MPSFSAELVARTPLSPRVVGMTFVADAPFPRAAGQYVRLSMDDGVTHAFSMASPYSDSAPGAFEIAVARGTTAANVLELALGSVVAVSGPSGALVWKEDAASLFVATGTGISPLRAIVLEQLARPSGPPLALLFGCRDASEELWGAELSRLAQEHRRFRFVATHSQPLPGRAERIGRVQAYLPEVLRELGSPVRSYLCGHTPMVNDCTRLLLELGVLPDHIHGESY
ncbi:MAG: FAD-dependent oxidoreductase [Myxococcales bacterium]|nr:MAG: FAD-dependent oxidoreductase [Myxococcales bacterium]